MRTLSAAYKVAVDLQISVYLSYGIYELDSQLELQNGVSIFGSFSGIVW